MKKLRSLKLHVAIAICLAGLTLPAAALGTIFGNHGGGGHHGGGSTSTPAPIAGAGLIAISVAGAAIYLAVRRFRKPD